VITEKLTYWIASVPNNPIRASISMLMGMPPLEVATRSVAGKREAATWVTRRLRVKSCPDSPEVQLPLYPRKRAQLGHGGMSEKCQFRTSRLTLL
jgi:hypothetical protein